MLTYHRSQHSNSCQCTECRRQSGTLALYTHTIPAICLHWVTQMAILSVNPPVAQPVNLRYSMTKSGYLRGFCSNCGSTLYWKDDNRRELEIALGTVDPEFLIGSCVEPGRATSTAAATPTDDGYGFALVNCSGVNYSYENQIKGVTDKLVTQQRGTRLFKHEPPEGSEHMIPLPRGVPTFQSRYQYLVARLLTDATSLALKPVWFSGWRKSCYGFEDQHKQETCTYLVPVRSHCCFGSPKRYARTNTFFSTEQKYHKVS